MKPQLLLQDLSSVFWWKWHAAAGQPVDTAFEYTTGRVRELATGYSHVAVCCDAGRSFRYDLDPDYKAKRPPRDQAAVAQLARVRDELRTSGFVLLEADGFEADDIIATAVAWAGRQDPPIEVVIAGMDKDLLSLVGERVSLIHVQSGNLVRPEDVRRKFGVGPEQMRDYLALVGDTSDSIKGVPKIGPENAKRLLAEFGSVDELVKALDQKKQDGSWRVAPDSIRESLTANLGALGHALGLVTLRTDAPVLELFEKFDLFATCMTARASKRPENVRSTPSPVFVSPPPLPALSASDRKPRPVPASAPSTPDQGSDLALSLGLLKHAMHYFSHSAELGQLAAALSRAQGAMPHAERDSRNPHFSSRYADLASVIDACRLALAANGLSVVQLPAITDRGNVLRTRLLHASGQWIESEIPVLTVRSGPQEYGSALTYARRYALAAMVGVAPDDDDAEAAEGRGADARRPAPRR